MKVLAYHKFGTVDVLNVESVPAQTAPANGVLVDVRASSVNVIDSRSRLGAMNPFVDKKFPKVPGVDFSGVVSANWHGRKPDKNPSVAGRPARAPQSANAQDMEAK